MDRYPFRPLFSASSLDSISRCPGAATLARFEVSSDDLIRDRRVKAAAGTVEHAAVLTPKDLPEDILSWLTSGDPTWELQFESKMALDLVWGDEPRAFHLDDLRLDLPKLVKSCELKPWAAGTPDVFAVRVTTEAGEPEASNCVAVRTVSVRLADLKTGEGQASGTLPHPARSWQLRFYLLAVLLTYHWPTHPQVRLGECAVSFWTRDYEAERASQPDVPADERAHLWRCEEASLDEGLLLASLDELTSIAREVARGSSAHFRQGAWCGRCSHVLGCPAHQNAVERLGVAVHSPAGSESLAEAFESLQVVRALVKHAEATVEAWAAALGEVPVRGGVLGFRESTRKKLGRSAVTTLEAVRPGIVDRIERPPPSLAALSRALGEKKPGSLTAGLLDELAEYDPDSVQVVRSRELRVRRDD